jgi:hypothetical protein
MRKFLLVLLAVLPSVVLGSPLADFSFKSPAFNGNGYGTYVLTIKNEQYTRSQTILASLESAKAAAAADAKNRPINQFLPYRTPSIHSEVDQWVQQVSMNGVRWSNLCKPD